MLLLFLGIAVICIFCRPLALSRSSWIDVFVRFIMVIIWDGSGVRRCRRVGVNVHLLRVPSQISVSSNGIDTHRCFCSWPARTLRPWILLQMLSRKRCLGLVSGGSGCSLELTCSGRRSFFLCNSGLDSGDTSGAGFFNLHRHVIGPYLWDLARPSKDWLYINQDSDVRSEGKQSQPRLAIGQQ